MKISFIIYKPAKSSMQSGLLNTKKWCLTNSSVNESYKSPKFGWDGSTNPEKKIELFFETLDEAKRFAQTKAENELKKKLIREKMIQEKKESMEAKGKVMRQKTKEEIQREKVQKEKT